MEKIHLNLNQAQEEYRTLLTDSFKLLLETKHLYQSVKINVPAVFEKLKKILGSKGVPGSQNIYRFQDYISHPIDTTLGEPYRPSTDPTTRKIVSISLPTIKVYCSKCKRVEPFNPFANNNVITQRSISYSDIPKYQLFILEYQCQSCKESPHVFIVRKEGYKLSLHGRSPIEVYPLPSVIPKKFQKYFSDSIIAYNSGQVLAAIFLLRTFIEQFIRAKNDDEQTDHADEVLTSYMAGLPSDFKQRFPSLKKIYGDLSSALHNAEPNNALFEKSRDEIIEHFEARKLFKLS